MVCGTRSSEEQRYDAKKTMCAARGHSQFNLPLTKWCDHDAPDPLHLDINAMTMWLKMVWSEAISGATKAVGVDNEKHVKDFLTLLRRMGIKSGAAAFQQEWDKLSEGRKGARAGKEGSTGGNKPKERMRLNGACAIQCMRHYSKLVSFLYFGAESRAQRLRRYELLEMARLMTRCSEVYCKTSLDATTLAALCADSLKLRNMFYLFRPHMFTPTIIAITFEMPLRAASLMHRGLSPACASTQSNERRNRELKEGLHHISNHAIDAEKNKWYQLLCHSSVIAIFLDDKDPRPIKYNKRSLARRMHTRHEVRLGVQTHYCTNCFLTPVHFVSLCTTCSTVHNAFADSLTAKAWSQSLRALLPQYFQTLLTSSVTAPILFLSPHDSPITKKSTVADM